MKPSSLQTVTHFCEAWSRLDFDELMGYLSADAVYHNIPLDPVIGHDAIRTTIAGFTKGVDRVEFEIVNAAAAGHIVLTERIDRFFAADQTISLPVMGTFEVTDGLITAWRDYFDLNQFMSQLASG